MLAHLPNISLAAAEVRSARFGWTMTVDHCYGRAPGFRGDFTPNAFYVTAKSACMMVQVDEDKLRPGDDVVYAMGSPVDNCTQPFYCNSKYQAPSSSGVLSERLK